MKLSQRLGQGVAAFFFCTAPTFAVAQTSNIALPLTTQANVWLNAGAGVTTSGSSVTTWVDQSGNTGRNATQATSTAQPTLLTSSTDFAGQAALQFDGGDSLAGTWRASSSSQVSLFAVYKLASSSGIQSPVMTGPGAANQGFGMGWNTSFFNSFLWAGADSQINGFNSATQIQAGTINGGSGSVWLNGQTASATGGSANISTGYTVGTGGNGGFNLGNGSQLAEVVIFDTALAAADVTTMGNYFAAKYAVATTTSRLWSGGSNDASAASNWGGTLNSGDQLVFTGTTQTAPSLATNLSAAGVAFTGLGTSGSFALGGSGTLTLGANGVANWTTSNQSISAPLSLSRTAVWNIVGGVSAGGSISGTGGLTKSGTGTLTLSGSNTFSGATTINAGVLQVVSPASLYGGTTANWTAANIATGSGATLVVSVGASNFTTDNVTTLLTNLGGLGGAVNNNGLRAGSAIGFDTSSAGGSFTVADSIQDSTGTGGGAIGIVKLGSGTLALSGSNTYAGSTTVNAGTLLAANASALGGQSGRIVAQGGVLDLGGYQFTRTGTISFAGGTVQSGTLSSDTATFDGQSGTVTAALAGAAGLTKTTSGTLALAGNNTYSGTTIIAAGVLQAGGTAALGSGNIRFTGGTLQYTAASAGTDWSTRFNNSGSAIALDTNDQAVTLAGIIDSTNTGGLTKLGSGTLALNGANTFSGAARIVAGTLELGNVGALANSTLDLNSSDSGTVAFSVAGTNTYTLGGLQGSRNLANGGNTVSVGGNGGSTTYSGVYSGTGGLTKTGTGTLALSGGNTYSGTTTINAGVLQFVNPAALYGGTTANWTAANIVTGSGATLAVNVGASNFSAGNVTTLLTNLGGLGGAVTNNGLRAGSAIGFDTSSAGGSFTVADSIQDSTGTGGGAIGIVKLGSGTLALSGANSYSGTTSIAAGVLQPVGTAALGSGNIRFSGGTLQYTAATAGTDWATRIKGSGSAIALDTNGQNVTLAAAIDSTNTAGLTKLGSGTLTLSGNNGYTGVTTVSAGGLTVGVGGSINAGGGTVTVANGSSNAALTINGGSVTGSNATGGAAAVTIGSGTGAGVVTINSGALTTTGFIGEIWVGANATSAGYGALLINGGTVTTSGWLGLGRSPTASSFDTRGLLQMTGGALTVGTATGNLSIGAFQASTAATSVMTISGGTAAMVNNVLVGEQLSGILDVSGGRVQTGVTSSVRLREVNNAGTIGFVNLRGGTIATGGVGTSGIAGTSIFNFNGGTLQALQSSTTFMTGLTQANVFSGGAVIDTNGNAVTIAQSLLAASGTGVSTIAVSGGSGYVAPPLVSISGGGGTGATALATVDASGNLTGITVTNPGTGYTSNPTVTLFGGGGAGATIGSIGRAANATSGGLTKTGSGTLTLSGTNTYAGTTTINAGLLQFVNPASLYGGTTANWTAANIVTGSGATLVVSVGTSNFTAGNVTTLLTNLGGLGGAVNNNGLRAGATIGFDTSSAGGSFTVADSIQNSTGTGGGAIGVVKLGSGTLTLTGVNTYAGATTISAGVLRAGGTAAFGSQAAAIVAQGGTLDLGGYQFTRTGTVSFTGGTVESGTLTNSTVAFDAQSGTVTATLGGTAGLTKTTAGTLALSGANTYSGNTRAVAGTLQLGNVGALANSTLDLAAADSGAIAFTVAGTNTYTLGGLQGSRNLANGGNTLTVGGNGGSTTYSGVYSGAGGLTKTGTGAFTLSNGGNLYSGPTVINQGTLISAGADSSSCVRGNITINAGATLQLNVANSIPDTSPITINGGTFAMQSNMEYIGNLTLGGGGVVSGDGSANQALITNGVANSKIATSGTGLAGTISSRLALASQFGTVQGNRTQEFAVGTDATLLITGTIINTQPGSPAQVGSLLKTGSGTLALAAANTYTGSTSIAAGTLQIGSGGTAGALATTSAITGSAGATLAFSRANTVTQGTDFNSVIGGAINVSQLGSGTLVLNGANTYSGTTTINAGVLQFVNPTSLYGGTTANWTAANIVTGSGATLVVNVVASNFTAGNVTTLLTNLGGAVNNNGLRAGSAIGFDTSSAGGSFTVADAIQNSTGTGGGAIGVVKLGSGTLVLNGVNTYSGTTTINAGVLQFVNPTSLYGGTTANWTAANIVTGSGATLAVNVGASNFTAGNVTTLLTNLGGLGAAVNNNGLRAGSTICFDTSSAGGSFTVADSIQNSTGNGGGAIGVVKLGSGTLALTAVNTYSGATRIVAGTLEVGNVAALANSTLDLATGDAGTVAFTVAGTNTYTLGGLQGSRNLANGGNTLTVGGNGGSTTYSGVYSGAGGLTKTGTGTLTLSSAANSYTGPTVINQGTLISAGADSSSCVRGNITINAGATLQLNVANSIPDTSPITINGGTFAMQSNMEYIGNLTLGGGGVVSGDSSANQALITNGVANSKIATSGTGLAGTISSRLALASQFGPVTGNRTQEFAIGTDATLLITGTIINTQPGSPAQVGSLLKTGSGTLTLTGNNTYSGGTTISAGTLRAASSSSLGTGGVTVNEGARLSVAAAIVLGPTRAVTVANGAFLSVDNGGSLPLAAASSLSGLESLSSISGSTLAAVRSGSSNGGTLSVNWLSGPDNSYSDAIDLVTGTGSIAPFVLQMSFDAGLDPSVKNTLTLGWLDTATSQWVNAVDGNTTGSATFFAGSWDAYLATNPGATATSALGTYGRDSALGTVWAAVNHNSEFAVVIVVPEPATLALVAAGVAVGALRFQRLRRHR